MLIGDENLGIFLIPATLNRNQDMIKQKLAHMDAKEIYKT